MLLVVLLVYLALKLSLDVLLGAFAAGVVVRLFIRGEDREQVDSKLPLILVITTIGVDEQKMKPQNAAALVAAGMLSVLVYPILGLRRLRSDPVTSNLPNPTDAAGQDQ
jgi:hypothetical protein